MSNPETELEMVMRHVRDGERHVASQRGIVASLQQRGHSTETALATLSLFEKVLVQHREHLARLLAE